MDDQALIERGRMAKALLDDQFFQLVIRDVETDIVGEMFNTAPHESKRRESLYSMQKGLMAIAGTLEGYVFAAEEAQGLHQDLDNE